MAESALTTGYDWRLGRLTLSLWRDTGCTVALWRCEGTLIRLTGTLEVAVALGGLHVLAAVVYNRTAADAFLTGLRARLYAEDVRRGLDEGAA